MDFDFAIPFGDTLRPSEEEFIDFKGYIQTVVSDPRFKNISSVKVNLLDHPSWFIQVWSIAFGWGFIILLGLQANRAAGFARSWIVWTEFHSKRFNDSLWVQKNNRKDVY